MSNLHKTYSFGAPIWGSTSNTIGASPNWASMTAIAVAMNPPSDEHQIGLQFNSTLKSLLGKINTTGIYFSQLPEEYVKLATHQVFRLPLEQGAYDEMTQDDEILSAFVSNTIAKLEIIRDQANADVYIFSTQLRRSLLGSNEFVIELWLLGDLTGAHDIYLNPVTGEIVFNQESK